MQTKLCCIHEKIKHCFIHFRFLEPGAIQLWAGDEDGRDEGSDASGQRGDRAHHRRLCETQGIRYRLSNLLLCLKGWSICGNFIKCVDFKKLIIGVWTMFCSKRDCMET